MTNVERSVFTLVAWLFLCTSLVHCEEPVTYKAGDYVPLFVADLTRSDSFFESPTPYYRLPFCKPPKFEKQGKLWNSLYEITAYKNVSCQVLCQISMDKEELKLFSDYVSKDFSVNWVVDDLPALTSKRDNGQVNKKGFPLGVKGKDVHYINNHASIKLLYHEDPAAYEGLRIVGFEVYPESVHHNPVWPSNQSFPSTCLDIKNVPFEELVPKPGKSTKDIIWTYSVTWEESDIPWSNRWVKYSKTDLFWVTFTNMLDAFKSFFER